MIFATPLVNNSSILSITKVIIDKFAILCYKLFKSQPNTTPFGWLQEIARLFHPLAKATVVFLWL
jgi:hypothetical protein